MTWPLQKKAKVRTKEGPPPEFEKHKKWVTRTYKCVACVKSGEETGDIKIDPHHVRYGLPAGVVRGTGLKPDDRWVVPLCRTHHDEIEAVNSGPATFERKYGLELAKIASQLWQGSPHGRAYRLKRERE